MNKRVCPIYSEFEAKDYFIENKSRITGNEIILPEKSNTIWASLFPVKNEMTGQIWYIYVDQVKFATIDIKIGTMFVHCGFTYKIDFKWTKKNLFQFASDHGFKVYRECDICFLIRD